MRAELDGHQLPISNELSVSYLGIARYDSRGEDLMEFDFSPAKVGYRALSLGPFTCPVSLKWTALAFVDI